MPFKWKFFKFCSYFHLLFVLMLTVVMLFGWIGQDDNKYYWIFICAALCMSILFANGVNNLILLGKYYPEKLPGGNFVVYTKIVLVPSVIILLFLGFVTGYGIYEEITEMKTEKRGVDPTGFSMVFVLFLTTLSGFYGCWNQVVLRKTIRRNFNMGIDQFLSDDNP